MDATTHDSINFHSPLSCTQDFALFPSASGFGGLCQLVRREIFYLPLEGGTFLNSHLST